MAIQFHEAHDPKDLVRPSYEG